MVNICEETVNSCLLRMQTFTGFTGKTEEQLLNEVDTEQDVKVKAGNMSVNKNLKGSGIICR
ncbi:hypothetical protein [Methanosarcina sp.]|jgi:hypothetical protein|uniref:hypothetical protein n=1 Tax=Methanosarcina sp. TaxID=2213 RepID=UPI002C00E73B|nr:hypothetical protein [Methanosarcina sp.]HOW15029.1 hypothetical protein [Methanosarcina sp.]